MKKVSCIIAAYNESERIGGVLDAIENHPLIEEVIVIDDGSKDNTSEIVSKRKGVKLITLTKNRGKSFAVVTGIRESKHDYLFMLDADLVGLSADDVTRLIQPILNDEADVSISLRKNSLPIMRMIGLDYISGERVFKKEILIEHLDAISELPSFAIESFFNRIIIKKNYKIKVVNWPNTITPRKSAKVGFVNGVLGDIKMIKEILHLVSFSEIISQNYAMCKLRIK
ncbi:MAG: glycosyltransferase family 2 protein [Candidatus Jorgensenbacteria bacterium]|nr:glycosyltransferase family 2 protein [Candidatus Jorgensenbacteria bacterium]